MSVTLTDMDAEHIERRLEDEQSRYSYRLLHTAPLDVGAGTHVEKLTALFLLSHREIALFFLEQLASWQKASDEEKRVLLPLAIRKAQEFERKLIDNLIDEGLTAKA